jgi:2-phospho-L-lactate/phosphoenolpyruvate guanylyltransferase
MRTLLLPVKDFRDAKQRLSARLTPSQRAGLARAMLNDVLTAISRARMPERVVVFTASDQVADIARHYNFDIIEEVSVRGHSAAVNEMVQELSSNASQILAIAADLPLLESNDVDCMFELSKSDINLVASLDGTGTNAVLFLLPARIEMQYGADSLQRHLSSARAAGLGTHVLSVPGIEFDVDTPEDLALFRQRGSERSSAWRYISAIS